MIGRVMYNIPHTAEEADSETADDPGATTPTIIYEERPLSKAEAEEVLRQRLYKKVSACTPAEPFSMIL